MEYFVFVMKYLILNSFSLNAYTYISDWVCEFVYYHVEFVSKLFIAFSDNFDRNHNNPPRGKIQFFNCDILLILPFFCRPEFFNFIGESFSVYIVFIK